MRAVVYGNHIDHVVAREGGESLEVDQVHRDTLWGEAKGHTLTVVDKVVGNVRGLTVMDVGGSPAASIVADV